MRVYLAGAYSEGKTSLARRIQSRYGITLIPEVARTLLAEWEHKTFDTIRREVELVNKFQLEVFDRQFKLEKQIKDNFVSSRCIDNTIFLGKYGTALGELASSQKFKEYVEWLKDGTIFYVTPHKELIQDDGIRDTNYLQAVELSGAVRQTLELLGLKYITIDSLLAKDREEIIFRILDYVIADQNQ